MNTHKNKGVDALDRVIAKISDGSRPSLRQAPRDLINREILSGFADPDEIENEDRIGAHHARPFLKIDELPGEDGCLGQTDFRDFIDFHVGDCKCGAGEECQICCTDTDFAVLSMFASAERGPIIGLSPAGRELFLVSLSRDELNWRGVPN